MPRPRASRETGDGLSSLAQRSRARQRENERAVDAGREARRILAVRSCAPGESEARCTAARSSVAPLGAALHPADGSGREVASPRGAVGSPAFWQDAGAVRRTVRLAARVARLGACPGGIALLALLGALLGLSIGAAGARSPESGSGSGSGGHAIEAALLGASASRMQGTQDPGLRLVGIAGQGGDATLRAGALQLEGGFLHRLSPGDRVFRDGFEHLAR